MHVYIYRKRIEQYYNTIFNHDNPILTYLYTSNNASYIFNALFKNGTIMVQEWKRDEQPTNIGLPRRITSFFPGHSTFLLGETGLTTVERCFYSKKEKKKRGEKKKRETTRILEIQSRYGSPRQTIVKTRHGGVEWWCGSCSRPIRENS